MNSKSHWMTLGIVVFFGCNRGDTLKQTLQTAAVQTVHETLPSVAHPDYANWSRFPENSFVRRRKVVSNSSGEVVVTTKMWLETRTEKFVSVGSRVTVKRPDEPIAENDADLVNFPATYRLPKGMEESQFYLPSMNAKKTGTEAIKVGTSEFQATIYEWEESSEAGPTTVKLWRSDDIPGRFLRQELYTKSSETMSTEEVTEVEL